MMEGGSLDGRLEKAKEAALGPHDGKATVADMVGEAAGGITGALAGAAIGSVAGPVGTIIGGIAGAAGGWWSGRAISEAFERLTDDDETYYRKHYDTSPKRSEEQQYDDARPAYHLGHIAGMNPEYEGRRFEQIETDLQRGWNDDVRTRYGEWDAVRGYVEAGFNRGVRAARGGGARGPEESPRAEPPADRPARAPGAGAEPGERDPSGGLAPEGDKSRGGSDASKHRSIPRGTDESL